MERQEEEKKSRVVKIGSKESWESYVSQATNQGSPVSSTYSSSSSSSDLIFIAVFEICQIFLGNLLGLDG